MSTKDKQCRLALVLLLRILLTNTISIEAVVASEPYSSQSYYSQSSSGYGNENRNYFDNPDELAPTNGYSNEPYSQQHQQQQRQHYPSTSYGSSGSGFDAGEKDHSLQDSYQTQASFQAYLAGKFLPFRHEHESDGRASLVSFDNIDFNKSETKNHQPTEDVLYPPLDSELHQTHQPFHRQQQQHHLQSATDYMTANNYMSHSSSYASREKTPKDTAQMNYQLNVKPYIENENHQDQQQLPRTSSHFQFPTQFSTTNNNSNSPSRTYYVADSDLTDDNTRQDSQLQSHLVQLPVSVSTPNVQVPHHHHHPPSFGISSEPIPISKHVEITKHVPVPIYRQIHVPVRRPIRIEIPRPVISTIPRPYPIPIQTIKAVARPMVKEVKIPIEKVTPYPVEHRVPYVVEKRVPFQIEKQVAAPVYYPFPVKVPMVRTILHKKKAHLAPLHYYPHHQRIHM